MQCHTGCPDSWTSWCSLPLPSKRPSYTNTLKKWLSTLLFRCLFNTPPLDRKTDLIWVTIWCQPTCSSPTSSLDHLQFHSPPPTNQFCIYCYCSQGQRRHLCKTMNTKLTNDLFCLSIQLNIPPFFFWAHSGPLTSSQSINQSVNWSINAWVEVCN